MKLSLKERRFFELATVGGKGIRDAYREVYNPKDERTLSNCVTNKKKRRPDIFEAIDKHCSDLFQSAKEAQKAAVIKLATENALSSIEKREFLRKIISEEVTEETIVMIKDEPKIVNRKPSINDRIKAIAVDNKMAGHNAPTTLKHEAPDAFLDFIKQTLTTANQNIPDVFKESGHSKI